MTKQRLLLCKCFWEGGYENLGFKLMKITKELVVFLLLALLCPGARTPVHSPMLHTGKTTCCVCEKVTMGIIGAPLLALLSVLHDRAVIVHALHV